MVLPSLSLLREDVIGVVYSCSTVVHQKVLEGVTKVWLESEAGLGSAFQKDSISV